MIEHDLEGKKFYFDRHNPITMRQNVITFKEHINRNLTILDILEITTKVMEWFDLHQVYFLGNRTRMSYMQNYEKLGIEYVVSLTGYNDLYRKRGRNTRLS